MDFGNNLSTWILGGTAVGGILTAFWGWIKLMANHLASLVYVRVTCTGAMSKALYSYCWAQMKVSPFGHRNYGATKEFVRPRQRVMLVGFESLSGTIQKIFWKGWKPVLMIYHENDGLVLIFPRHIWSVDKFMVDVENYYNTVGLTSENRFRIEHRYGSRASKNKMQGMQGLGGGSKKQDDDFFDTQYNLMLGEARILQWKPEDLGYIPRGAFDTLEFPKEVWEHVKDVSQWLRSESWYQERNLTWKRGWLLAGMPGCGKTSLVRSMAKEFNLPVFIFDLASFEDEEFMQEWKRLQSESPCVVLCEDIDTVFNGRLNMTANDQSLGLNFDTFLNAIDGAEQSHGLFLCITTNRVELLDEALGVKTATGVASRPGRIDVILELPLLTEENRRAIGKRILKDCCDKLEEIVKAGEGETGAQFTERCSQIALQQHWTGINASESKVDSAARFGGKNVERRNKIFHDYSGMGGDRKVSRWMD